MRKLLIILTLVGMGGLLPAHDVEAQALVAAVIKKGIKKAIKAVDLKIQRLQNKTILLQNAQKELENKMSKLKLEEIAGWVRKQRDLYQKYYEELWKVKAVISYYDRIREITLEQTRLVKEYDRAWSFFKQDPHFTPDELQYMAKVYQGILEESAENIERLTLLVQPFTMQMSDAARMRRIEAAGEAVDANYRDLVNFNRQNALLSLQRAKGKNDAEVVKALYGLP
jgi:hypothetical protein